MKVLFISHEASLTGAPLFLLNICKYLKEHTNWKLYFLLKHDGPLREDFEELGITLVYGSETRPDHFLAKLIYKLANSFIGKKRSDKAIVRKLKNFNIDLIYSNTATNGKLLETLSILNVKIVTHVHELEWAINLFGRNNLELVKKYTDHYVCTSPSVSRFVKEKFNKDKVFEFKCFPIQGKPTDIKPILIKAELGIPESSFVVGASGTVEWRKGWDLFVRLAWEIQQINSELDIYFVWVGGINHKIVHDVAHEVNLAGLENKVLFIGQQQMPMHYYSILDVFCLMSREEAFGIVAIESALFATPVICFDVAEGLAGFVQQDAGFVVPYPDTKKMAEHIIALKYNIQLKEKLGKTGLHKVDTEHNIVQQGNLLINYLKAIK